MRKRYLLQVAAVNLALIMRSLLGRGTPRQAAEARKGRFALVLVLWAAVEAVVALVARAADLGWGALWRTMEDRGHRLRLVAG